MSEELRSVSGETYHIDKIAETPSDPKLDFASELREVREFHTLQLQAILAAANGDRSVDHFGVECDTLTDVRQLRMQYEGLQESVKQQGMYHLETGHPATLTIDEDYGRLLIRCYQTLRFLLDEPSVELTPERNAEQFDQMQVPDLMRKLEAAAMNNTTTYIPYPMMVDQLFKMQETDVQSFGHAVVGICTEAGELLDNYKKQWIYGKKLTDIWDEKKGQTVAQNIHEELGDIAFYMQKILNMFGWSWDQIKVSNRLKLAQRYPNAVYTDEAANARADKQ